MTNKGKETSEVLDKAKDLFGGGFRVASDLKDIEFIPTDFEEINKKVFICGGLPRGRAIEIAGKTHTGKSTFCQWLVAQVQKRGGLVTWFDAEGAFEKVYAKGSGIDLEKLVMPPLGYGEDTLYKIELALASNLFDLIVIDSQDAIKPEAIAERSTRMLTMNERLLRPKMWAEFYKDLEGGFEIKAHMKKKKDGKIVEIFEPIASTETIPIPQKDGKIVNKKNIHKLQHKKTCILMVAHLVPTMNPYGKAEDTAGSNELKFLYSLRIWIKSRIPIYRTKKGKKYLNYCRVRLQVEKGKIGQLEGDGKYEIKMMPNGTIELMSGEDKKDADLLEEVFKEK